MREARWVALVATCGIWALLAAAPAAAGPPVTGIEGPHRTIPGFGTNSCSACHGIVPGPTGPDAVRRPNETCLGCHGDPRTSPSDGIPRAQATIVNNHDWLITGSSRFRYGDFGAPWNEPLDNLEIHCTTCHDPHRTLDPDRGTTQNTQYIRAHTDDWQLDAAGQVVGPFAKQLRVIDETQGGVTVTKTVDQDIVYAGTTDFADGVGQLALETDVCEVCHTLTNHHQVDDTAPGGQSHFDGEDCTQCHTHPSGFRPEGAPLTGPHALFGDPNCGACHDSPAFPGGPDNPAGLPSVFCQTCHGPGSLTDSAIHSHIVTGSSKFEYGVECLTCHDQHGWEITNVDGTDNLEYVRARVDETISVIDKTGPVPVQVTKLIAADIVFDSLDDFANGDPDFGRDICVTCHTLTNHHQNDGTAPGGQSHNDGTQCTTCHQHLEGFRPPGGLAGPPVAGPHAAMPGFPPGDCLVCHDLFPTVEEMKANATTVCLSCHSDSPAILAATPEHVHSSVITGSTRFDYAVECATCHTPHGWAADVDNVEGGQNIKYVRANIDELITVVDNTVSPPATATKQIDHDVVFTASTGPGSFADGDANYTEDICNTCHTLTNHHQNDGTAPGGQAHFDGQQCTQCHLHPEGFGGFGGPHPQAVTDCANCHLGPDGEPDLQALHGNDCELCHSVAIPATFLGPPGTWNQECSACHNPFVAETGYADEPTRGHRCVVCHGEQRSTANIYGIHEEHREEASCVVCHGFIPDVGTEIGSGNRQICVTCHGSPRADTGIEEIHDEHIWGNAGLSCLECHGDERPPVDVVFGPPVGNANVVCEICHEYRNEDVDKIHRKHTDEGMDCGFCHLDANLQDDRVPMPPVDDARRALVDRAGENECGFCHPPRSREIDDIHHRHHGRQQQWCYNCHEGDDGRPLGLEPPVTQPRQACRLCHENESYNDTFPFDIHEEHAGKDKCYACHQARPQLFDWPLEWLGGSGSGGPGPGGVTVRDEFNSVSFSNNDGPDDWAGPWLEDDPDGSGPSAGNVRVVSGGLRLDDRPNTGGEPGAARTVDLSYGASSATFSFDWRTTSDVDSGDEITVDVSSNGGASYTVLDRITGFSGARTGSESHDISPWISAATTIRFRVTRYYGGDGEYFYADNVEIAVE